MEKKFGSGIRNKHPGSYFHGQFSRLKIFKVFVTDSYPGSGAFLTLDPGSGMGKIRIRDKHPESATLQTKYEKVSI